MGLSVPEGVGVGIGSWEIWKFLGVVSGNIFVGLGRRWIGLRGRELRIGCSTIWSCWAPVVPAAPEVGRVILATVNALRSFRCRFGTCAEVMVAGAFHAPGFEPTVIFCVPIPLAVCAL